MIIIISKKAEIQKFNQYALILISLLNIRALNDLFGYKVVDELFEAFCYHPKVASKNDFLYVLSYKEILLILPNSNRKEIKKFVEDNIIIYRSKKDANLWFDIRVGISIYPDHVNAEKSLLDETEVALNKTSNLVFRKNIISSQNISIMLC